jgi:secreted Zn-dependent insulinase-like peptidase
VLNRLHKEFAIVVLGKALAESLEAGYSFDISDGANGALEIELSGWSENFEQFSSEFFKRLTHLRDELHTDNA